MKKRFLLIILLLFIILSPRVSAQSNLTGGTSPNYNPNLKYYRGEVVEILDYNEVALNPNLFKDIYLIRVKILDKDKKGDLVEIVTPIMAEGSFNINYKLGDQLIVFTDPASKTQEFNILDHYRMTWVYYLFGLFFVIILLVGRKSGLKALFSMIVSIVSIFVIIKLTTKGYAPIPLTIAISIINTITTILVIGGASKKSLAAIFGTITGIFIAFALAVVFGNKAYVTGVSNESANMMLYLERPIEPREIIFASMVLGSLGAVMDVTMSIASAVEEIKRANENAGLWQLYKAGMNVGRDIMGTMSNTLVLAYFASALPLTILMYSYSFTMPYFYNLDIFVTELVRTLTGSIGLILVIPLTCIISAVLYKNGNNRL